MEACDAAKNEDCADGREDWDNDANGFWDVNGDWRLWMVHLDNEDKVPKNLDLQPAPLLLVGGWWIVYGWMADGWMVDGALTILISSRHLYSSWVAAGLTKDDLVPDFSAMYSGTPDR